MDDIEKRIAEIEANPPEELTPEEESELVAAMAMNDNEECSGRISLRIPASLHRSLKIAAKKDKISLNQYLIYRLSR